MTPTRTCRACRRPLRAPSPDGYGPKCRRKAQQPPDVRAHGGDLRALAQQPRPAPPGHPTLDDAEPEPVSTDPEQYRTDAYGTPCYRHTDPDGDQVLAAASYVPGDGPGTGPGIYLRTTHAGASIPLAHLDQFIARLHTIADVARAEAPKERRP
ncbi:hypothetical protein [Streptomyces sp. IpFD-1.1]|uniref:hypothetical protein n=1 Tax=Streptomyces sp. IpFD-1.1 TaxID=2841664 RepID=UPI002095B392|nr:hypothetical protein [Streptomyces sp. IpFD-1.1]